MLVSVTATCTLSTAPASAHALLVAGAPAPGSLAPIATGVVRLTFTERVAPSLSRFHAADAHGATELIGPVVVDGRTVYLPVRLRAGPVAVTWVAVGEDAHPVRGQYVFTAVAAGERPARAASADFSEGNAGSAGLAWVIKLGRFGEVTLLYLVLGTLLVRVLVLRNAARAGDRVLLVSGINSVLLVPLLFLGYAARLHETTGRSPAVLSTISLTWLVKLALWIAFCLLVRHLRRPWADLALLGTAMALALAFVANTHAAGRTPWWAGVMWLHVLVTALWAGGLAALLLLVLPGAGGERSQLVLERFSRIMLPVVGGILATGLALLVTLAGSWQRAWCTSFGLVAGFKLSVVAVALLLGLVNNRIIAFAGRRLAGRSLVLTHRVMALEAAALLVVLALSAQLGETALPPAIKGALLPGDAQTSVNAGLMSSGCR